MFISNMFVDPHLLIEASENEFYGIIQLLFHGMVYGYILFVASNMISEGSELLLLTPLKGVVGSVVLPVLGAVPDGAIILFSKSDQLAVGVGALAGSTIMLLTIPWFLAILAGRVNLAPEDNTDNTTSGPAVNLAAATLSSGKLVPKYSGRATDRLLPDLSFVDTLTKTGVSVEPSIRRAGHAMLITSFGYLAIQIPAIAMGCASSKNCGCSEGSDFEHCTNNKVDDIRPFAIAGCALAAFFFIMYLVDQFRESAKDDSRHDRKAEEVGKKALASGLHVDFCVFLNSASATHCCGGDDIELEALQDAETSGAAQAEFSKRISKLFRKYNTSTNDDGAVEIIDSMEVGQLLSDMNMRGTTLWHDLRDVAHQGELTEAKFAQICWDYVTSDVKSKKMTPTVSCVDMAKLRNNNNENEDEEEGDSDEELEVPEGMEGKDLSQPAQQREIWKRAIIQMFTGTAIVMFFSDPMCDIFSEIGTQTTIDEFYVSFVLAPLASNASELLAAYNYALKKTRKTMTISISSLLGAACMNNTFCLAIFLFKIAASDQLWVYTAETLSIVMVEWMVYGFALLPNHKTYYGVLVLMLFPVSIVAVAVMEAAGLD
eukprot:TRINITY_DN898_c2_g1_i1.p1 TRINITY_DN898_c2_g1~~TRINITY_DN898_c2_g1_i1.p1  ORF type:complete len:601 (+),score=130.61 TRINITY_DN898_c2_g1_i1:88-1890(+)